MDLRQLRYFAEVAAKLNFRAAAARLNVSQSSLSRRISDLEEALGVQLLDRHPRGVTLTASGQTLFARAEALLRDVEAVRAEITGSGPAAGIVTLGTSDAVSRTLLAPLTAAVAAGPSSIQLRFVEGPQYVLFEGLDSGRIDLAVMTTPEPIASCQMEVILLEPLHLVTRFAERVTKSLLSIDDLDGVPLVMFPRPSGNRNHVERAARARGVALNCRYEVSSTSAQRAFVQEGLACCILPFSAVAQHLGEGALACAPLAGLALTRTLVWRGDRSHSPAVTCVSDLVRVIMSERRPPGALLPLV